MASRRLKVVLLESSLELVPKEIANHPAVVKNAKKRGKRARETLLDTSIHYFAMRGLKDREKRGRPDIVHVSLLYALESPLNRSSCLEIYVHTYSGHIIFVDSKTRIPRNYSRFVGLMEQLLVVGRVPPSSSSPLMRVKPVKVNELLSETNSSGLILLREGGARRNTIEIAREAIENEYLIGIGGFPRGDFSEEILSASSAQYSIYDEPLAAWIVLSRVIVAAESYLGVLPL